MNAFARHNVKHLSASSLNCWRSAPGLWAVRYLLGVKDNGNPAMWRGTATEGGLEAYMRGRPLEDAVKAALSNFEANAQGEASDEVEAERNAIRDYVEIACRKVHNQFPVLTATQLRIEHWLDGIPVPLIGYVDFVFEDGSLFDLKTTMRIPSEPKPDHARQVSIYMKARHTEAGSLLYVSPKRAEHYHITNPDEHLAGLRRDALALMRFLDRFETAEEAARALPADTDHFMWSDATKARALELWS